MLTDDQAQSIVDYELKGTLEWYSKEADKWERRAWKLQVAFFVMSALVTISAAFPSLPDYQLWNKWDYQLWVKWLVVVLSAVTTLLSGLLAKSGIEHTALLREQGRIEIWTLKSKTFRLLTMKEMTDDERLGLLKNIADRRRDIELRCGVNPVAAARQHRSD